MGLVESNRDFRLLKVVCRSRRLHKETALTSRSVQPDPLMKLHFEPNLDYQLQAIEAVCDLFRGQETRRTEFTVTCDVADVQQRMTFDQNDLGIGNRLTFIEDKNGTERLYFVVETTSSLFTEDLRDKESAKIKCGEAHFAELATHNSPAAQFIKATILDDVLSQC